MRFTGMFRFRLVRESQEVKIRLQLDFGPSDCTNRFIPNTIDALENHLLDRQQRENWPDS